VNSTTRSKETWDMTEDRQPGSAAFYIWPGNGSGVAPSTPELQGAQTVNVATFTRERNITSNRNEHRPKCNRD